MAILRDELTAGRVRSVSPSISAIGRASVGATEDRGAPVQQAAKPLGPEDFRLWEGAEDALYIVCNPHDAVPLAQCTTSAILNVDFYKPTKQFTRNIKDRLVILMVPGKGPGHIEAMKASHSLREAGVKVVDWTIDELGLEDTPDLVSYDAKLGPAAISKALLLDQPWRPQARVPEPQVNGNGQQLAVEEGYNCADLSADQLHVREASKVKKRPTDWCWLHRVALGEMTLIAGEGGLGKSQITLWMAAAISNGWEWPDGTGKAPVGTVIIVTAEDSPETTIVPRLEALGANLDKIKIITSPHILVRRGKETLVDTKALGDRPYWERVFDLFPDTKLFIVDPIASYMGKGISDQKNDDVRSVLIPLIDNVIRPRGIAFMAITHLNKSLEAKSVKHRINASIAFVNIPRNVHAVLRDLDDRLKRVFGQVKCNNAPDDLPSFLFSIQAHSVESDGGPIETSIPVFDKEPVSMDLNRVMTGEKGHRGQRPVESVKVATWLFERLKEGMPVRIVDLVVDAREAGLLITPTASDPKPSISPLYNAMRRLPGVHAGWDVEELQCGKLKAWQLVSTVATEPNPSAAPY